LLGHALGPQNAFDFTASARDYLIFWILAVSIACSRRGSHMARLYAFTVSLGLLCQLAQGSAWAQGASEAGSLWGLPKGVSSKSLAGAVSKLLDNDENLDRDIPTKAANGLDLDAQTIAKLAGKNANAYYAMAQKKESAGKLDEALKFYFRALGVRERVWGDKDPAAIAIIFKIAQLHLKMGNQDAAQVCFKRYLSIESKQYGPGAYELVPALNELGKISLSKKIYTDAYGYFSRLLPLEERKSGSDAPQTCSARINLVDATIGLKEWKEAEKYLKEADSIAIRKGEEQSKSYGKVCQDYAEVLNAMNRPQEAQTYAGKAEALRALAPNPRPAAKSETVVEPTKSKAVNVKEKTPLPVTAVPANAGAPVPQGAPVPSNTPHPKAVGPTNAAGAPQPGGGQN
jgi:tetratricopeptide (TPR) repeat protein